MKNERAEVVVEEERTSWRRMDDIIAWSGQICKFTTKHFFHYTYHHCNNSCSTPQQILVLTYNGFTIPRLCLPPMHPTSPCQIHLPTEVILLIVSLAATNADNDAQRQRTMHTCCLVSRQWYSAAVAFLYEKPRLDRGRAFYKFTDTISPPVAARKSKMNLGSMVRKLDLSCLVHHSKNSLTARLLGKVKENLEVFIAPSVTFA